MGNITKNQEKYMKKRLLALCLALSCLFLGGCAFGGADYATKEDLEAIKQLQTAAPGNEYNITINSSENSALVGAAKAILSVVSIECGFEELYSSGWPIGGPQTSVKDTLYYGSGVIYQLDKSKGDAYIITNYHVVHNSNATSASGISTDIKVFLYGSENEGDGIEATFVGGSANYDIALLKISGSAALKESIATAATFANSDKVSVLDTAVAIGNPAGMGISATAGYVSVDSEEIALHVSNSAYVSMRVMRVDTAVNGGNSGGGLFNAKGELIGIVNAKIADTSIENIAYAIPSNVAKHLATSILSEKSGKPTRCILGIVPAVSASKAVYDKETGKIAILETVTVNEIKEGSVAKGKLQEDDVIRALTIDGNKIEIQRKFQVIENMFAARVGSTVVFDIERNGAVQQVTFTITENMVTLM
jgi:serine protease Do